MYPPSYLAVVACLVSTFFLLACSAPAKIVREPSASSKPKWIEKTPQGSGTLYFVGIRTAADTLEEGQAAAIKDAMSMISGYLGTRIESVFEDEITDVEQRLRQQITSKSKSIIHGVNVVDSYYEKVARIDRNFRIEKFDVFVLVSFSKEDAGREISRQQEERKGKIKAAYDFYSKGIRLENTGEYYEAHEYLSQALSSVYDVEDVVAIDGDVKNSEDLKNAIKIHLQNVLSMLSRASIIMKTNESVASDAYLSSFSAELTKGGFTITDQQPALEIESDVSLSYGGYVLNNFVSYAEGRVTARRLSDGQIVAVYPFKVKGFHRIKEQAAFEALKEAGTDAGKNLTASLKK